MLKIAMAVCLLFGQGIVSRAPIVATNALQFSMPGGFQVFSLDPITITNFGGKYYHGGIIPENGAEITISVWEKSQTLRQLIARDLKNRIFTESIMDLNGQKAPLIVIVSDEPEIRENISVIYVEGKTVFYKLFLTYHIDDPNTLSHRNAFAHVLATVKFLR